MPSLRSFVPSVRTLLQGRRDGTRALALAALLGAVAAPVHAQRLTIVAGATFSNLRSSDDIDLENRTGTTFGVSLQLPVGASFTLQPELLFLNKGAKFRQTTLDPHGAATTGNVRLDYVEIPLLLRHDFARGVIGPHIYAGPSVGYNVGCSVGTSASSASSDCTKENFKPKSVDYGLTVGGGVDFNVGGIGATGGVRYGIGLADIRSDNSETFRNRVHNGVLSLYVGVGFGTLR